MEKHTKNTQKQKNNNKQNERERKRKTNNNKQKQTTTNKNKNKNKQAKPNINKNKNKQKPNINRQNEQKHLFIHNKSDSQYEVQTDSRSLNAFNINRNSSLFLHRDKLDRNRCCCSVSLFSLIAFGCCCCLFRLPLGASTGRKTSASSLMIVTHDSTAVARSPAAHSSPGLFSAAEGGCAKPASSALKTRRCSATTLAREGFQRCGSAGDLLSPESLCSCCPCWSCCACWSCWSRSVRGGERLEPLLSVDCAAAAGCQLERVGGQREAASEGAGSARDKATKGLSNTQANKHTNREGGREMHEQ